MEDLNEKLSAAIKAQMEEGKGNFMKILVINAGSSSLKYQLFNMKATTVTVGDAILRGISLALKFKLFPFGQELYVLLMPTLI